MQPSPNRFPEDRNGGGTPSWHTFVGSQRGYDTDKGSAWRNGGNDDDQLRLVYPAANPRPKDTSPWHFLLLIPTVVPLILPLYNRQEPRMFGIPFFFWAQLSFVLLTCAITLFVYQVTKKKSRR
jgi:hypothetical protein